jgi:hypothetical protein
LEARNAQPAAPEILALKKAADIKQRAAGCRNRLGDGAGPVHVEQERKYALDIVAIQIGREIRQRLAFVSRIDEPRIGIDD